MIRLLSSLGLVMLAALACGQPGVPAQSAPLVAKVPFVDGERYTYSLRDDTRAVIARGTLTTRRSGDGWELRQEYEEANPPQGVKRTSDVSAAFVDGATLLPRNVERVIERRDETQRYRAAYAPGTVTIDREGEKPRTLKLPVDAVYDNEAALWLWRTLPFAEGYRQRYTSVGLTERSRQTVSITVTGRQRVEVPAGAFEAWRLQVRNGRATRVAWINVDAPHQVVQWDNGTVVFQLEASR